LTRHAFLTKLATCRACRRDRLTVALIGGAIVLLVAELR
jgi:hypothetical protein